MGFVFGIDAGGTKTICAVADERGNLVSVGVGGPANYQLVGTQAAARSIKEAVSAAAAVAGIGIGDLEYGFYAVSGLDTEGDAAIIDGFIRGTAPGVEYDLDNDAIAPLALGTTEGWGIVLICGTGSNCVAVNRNRQRLQVGGIGPEFGDVVGGRQMAIHALAAAVRGLDGRGELTSLSERIRSHLGVEKLTDFAPVLHQESRAYPIARLAPLVFEEAKKGDKVAQGIIEFQGRELALSANVALRKLFSISDKVEVVLTGGLFKNEYSCALIESIRNALDKRYEGVSLLMPDGEPVLGALIQALRNRGIRGFSRERLIEQYRRI